MSFIYSQALVEAFLPASCSDNDASAPSSGSPTPKPCLWHDKTMDASRLSRFGMTCKPLTDDHGAALLTSWQEAFRVRIFQSRGGVEAWTAKDQECGSTLPASLARYDPDSHTLKTAQLSFLEDLTGCCLTLPRWGLMQDGECYPQPMWAPLTSVSESGYWQAPVADDSVNREAGKWNSRGEPKLSAQVMCWPTPTASDHTGPGHAAQGGLNLRTAVAAYPTPRASDHKGATDPAAAAAAAAAARGFSPNLPEFVAELSARKMYPTATATAYKGWSPNHNRADTDDRLDYTVEREGFQPGQQTPPMRLNPNWVEWLMGWPIGQTALKPLETDKFQEWQQQHSIY